MLDKRTKRIVWGFLLGVIFAEGIAIVVSFRAKGALLPALAHYVDAVPATAAAWLLAAIITVLYVAFTAARSPILRANMLRPWRWRPYAAMAAAAVPMALVSGFFEEAFFRKTLMDMLQHHGSAIATQIAVSALAFGAVHAVWGLMGGSVRGAAGAMLATSALGAALAAIYLIGGRSIAPCIASHTAINLVIEPWLIITAVTRGWTPRTAGVHPVWRRVRAMPAE